MRGKINRRKKEALMDELHNEQATKKPQLVEREREKERKKERKRKRKKDCNSLWSSIGERRKDL